jgi:hypothetical protein
MYEVVGVPPTGSLGNTGGWALTLAYGSLLFPSTLCHLVSGLGTLRQPSEDHVWFEDRWIVASLCDE